jgi:membrane protein DedA with SNARE-associated domain
MDFTSQEIIRLIHLWGYPLMFFLMIVEGPFATMIAAFLASQGFFNIGVVFLLSVAGDVVLYYIGWVGGLKIIEKAQKFLKIKDQVIDKLKNRFHQNSERLVFLVKSTTGLSYITFITAGALRMKFSLFIKNSILGGLVWSAMLVILGYFFGYAAEQISQYIKYAGFAVFGMAIIAVFVIAVIKSRESSEILKNGK